MAQRRPRLRSRVRRHWANEGVSCYVGFSEQNVCHEAICPRGRCRVRANWHLAPCQRKRSNDKQTRCVCCRSRVGSPFVERIWLASDRPSDWTRIDATEHRGRTRKKKAHLSNRTNGKNRKSWTPFSLTTPFFRHFPEMRKKKSIKGERGVINQKKSVTPSPLFQSNTRRYEESNL